MSPLRIALALALAAAAGCHQTMRLPPQMRGQRERETGAMDLRREYWDGGPSPKCLRSELEVLVFPGGRFEKHGRERSFYASGTLEYERHWRHGEPAGLWESWWENGNVKSRYPYAQDPSATEMSFWHANGALEARGLALRGRRVGPWEYFRDDGSRESAGTYVDGKRDGEWLTWDETGEVRDSAVFELGVLVEKPALPAGL